MHDKIIPDWAPIPTPAPRTFVQPAHPIVEEEITQSQATPDVAVIQSDSSSGPDHKPQLATA